MSSDSRSTASTTWQLMWGYTARYTKVTEMCEKQRHIVQHHENADPLDSIMLQRFATLRQAKPFILNVLGNPRSIH